MEKTTQELMTDAIKTIQQMSPEEKAKFRARLDKRLAPYLKKGK